MQGFKAERAMSYVSKHWSLRGYFSNLFLLSQTSPSEFNMSKGQFAYFEELLILSKDPLLQGVPSQYTHVKARTQGIPFMLGLTDILQWWV